MIEKRKKIIVTFIAAIILVSFNLNCVFADIRNEIENPGIIINDVKLNSSYKVIIEADKKYIPISKLQNNLGIKISVGDNNFVSASWSSNFLSFDIKNNILILNNKRLTDSFDIIIKEDGLYFSLDTITRFFNYKIEDIHELNAIRIVCAQNVLSKDALIKKYRKSVSKTEKFAYLTFDDGLDNVITPKILDVLKEYDVKATFFIVGNTIKRNTELLKRISEEGHSIGNHTYSHKKEIIYSSVENFKWEVEATSSYIYAVTNKRPKLFRPPYGSKVIKEDNYVKALSDYKVVMWNIDGMDSRVKNITSQQIADNVINSLKNKKKAIILLHVGKSKENTLKALPRIIEYLKENNYSIKTIDENIELK